jgi:hypothetical protein
LMTTNLPSLWKPTENSQNKKSSSTGDNLINYF